MNMSFTCAFRRRIGVGAVLLCALLPVAARAQFQYEIRGNTVALTRYTGPGGAVVTPDSLAGRPVTEIADFCATRNPTITSLTVGGSVTNIGEFAFYGCTNITKVTVGSGVRTIGDQAFRYCSGLTTLKLGWRLKVIGEFAFEQCTQLRSFTLPSRLYRMDRAAFMNCSRLTELVVPDSVRSIGHFAFYGCSRLTSVEIGDGLQIIGTEAFNQCSRLERVIIGRGLATVRERAFQVCRNLSAIYFYGNMPRFGERLHSKYRSVPFKLYYRWGTTGWTRRVQSHPTHGFSRLPTLNLHPTRRPVSHMAGTTGFWVTNSGSGSLTFEASVTNSWLSIVERSGQNPWRVYVAFDQNNGGTRTGLVKVTSAQATNSPQVVRVIQPRRPGLKVSPSTRSVSHLAGSTTFTVTNTRPDPWGAMEYSTVVNASWLSIRSGGTGVNDGTLEIGFTSNWGSSARTGTVTVTAPGAFGTSNKTVKVVQPARPSLSVTPGDQAVGHAADTVDFAIDNTRPGSTMTFSTSVDAAWLSIRSGGTGTSRGTLKIDCAANPDPAARTGTVTVTAPGAIGSPAVRRIIQPARPLLSVTPGDQAIGHEGGAVAFAIDNTRPGSTMTFSAGVDVGWLAIQSGGTGTTSGNLEILSDSNATYAARTGTVTVTAPGAEASPAVRRIVQAARPAVQIDPVRGVYSCQQSHGAIAVTSITNWTAVADVPWLTVVSGAAGTGDGNVTFNVATNIGDVRSGTITVAGGGVTCIYTANQWPAPTTPLVSAEGDFDGDAWADIAAFEPESGLWDVMFRTNGVRWQVALGGANSVPVPADYDGDGMVDFGVYEPATGEWSVLRSSDAGSEQGTLGGPDSIPVPGDYDGDGQADRAVYDQSEGRWYFQCTTAGNYSIQFGFSGWVPVPADYEGDGKTDVAVYYRTTGDWYILFSSTGNSTRRHLGWSTTRPVAADFNSDGRADLAVYHASSGDWYIMESVSSLVTKLHLGWSTTTPVAADYDGDGAADPAVYHTTSGNWYILPSAGWGVLNPLPNLGGPGWVPVLQAPTIHSWMNLP